MIGIIANLLGVSATKLVMIVAALAVLGVATGFIVHTLREQGRQEALQTIKDANDEAHRKAAAGQLTVDQCYDAGGSWNRRRGVCVGSDP